MQHTRTLGNGSAVRTLLRAAISKNCLVSLQENIGPFVAGTSGLAPHLQAGSSSRPSLDTVRKLRTT